MTERLKFQRQSTALTGVVSICLLAAFGSLQAPEVNNSKVANTQLRPLMGRFLVGRFFDVVASYLRNEQERPNNLLAKDSLVKLRPFDISSYNLIELVGKDILKVTNIYRPAEFEMPAPTEVAGIKPKPQAIESSASPPAQTLYVDSTSYCLTSQTAEGGYPYSGIVAMSELPFGTTVQVMTGSEAGAILRVEDRPDDKTQFDIWKGSCEESMQYGRQEIEIKILNEGN